MMPPTLPPRKPCQPTLDRRAPKPSPCNLVKRLYPPITKNLSHNLTKASKASSFSVYGAQQLSFQNILALLVFLRVLVGLVVLPAHRLLTLPTVDIADHMQACRHFALHSLGLGDVNDSIEQIGFSMLAAETLKKGKIGGVVSHVDIYRGWGNEGQVKKDETEEKERTHSTDDGIMTSKMGFTVLAAKYLVRV